MKTKLHTVEILTIILGSGLFAFGINYFTIPNQLTEGGLTGLTVIFHYLSDWSTGIINFTLNMVLFVFSVKFLDRKELIYTLIGIVASPTVVFFTDGGTTGLPHDTLVDAAFGD